MYNWLYGWWFFVNFFIQIVLGLLPAVLFFIAFIVFKKIKKTRGECKSPFVLLIFFSILTITLLFFGVSNNKSSEEEKLHAENSEKLNIALIYSVAEKENIPLALELLDSMNETFTETSETTLCRALLYAANGDAKNAKALFIKANTLKETDLFSEAVKLCDAAIKESYSDFAAESGLGKYKGPPKTPAKDDLVDFALEKLAEDNSDYDLNPVAESLTEADVIYSSFSSTGILEGSKARDIAEDLLDECEENPSLNNIPAIRLTIIKLFALSGSYDDIAAMINENSSFDELTIACELYVNDLIYEEDFSPEYGKYYAFVAEKVSDQLKIVKPGIPDTEPLNQQGISNLIASLETGTDNPAIERMKIEISNVAADETSSERPKAYMQLARMEYFDGNEEKAGEHISSALNTVGISDDDEFAIPMISIVDSITDKDNPEKVKDIAKHVKNATENSSDYIVVKAIENATANYDDSDDYSDVPSTDAKNPFEVFFADTASQKRNAFSITSVDATKFETVEVVVNVDPSISITEEELKQLICVKDCNVEIEDFSIKKVEYTGANILLCCDTSGSMDGQPINDLKNAVTSFVESSSNVENISLVTFDSSVNKILPFGTSNHAITSAASEIYASGGTNMYGAIIESLPEFTVKPTELNFILLLSDGVDNSPASSEDIANNIGSVCQNSDIVLFSLGLGQDVNSDYMNTIATSTGGYFCYVNDSASLDEFYSRLRSQILNRYIITYTAKDTLKANREVKISLKDAVNNNIVSDSKRYYMNGTDSDCPQTDDEQTIVELEGISVNGLDARRIFKTSKPVTVNIIGSGFEKTSVFSVKLDGKLDYTDIPCKYINATTLQLTLPGGIACGSYDLHVSIDDKQAILPRELTVSAKGTEKTSTFGNYVFTSDSRVETDEGVLLSGFVTLNGWLYFNGDVELTGNMSDFSIKLTDTEGAYIRYYKNSAEGLAKFLAEKNIALPLPALGTFNIYNDTNENGDSMEHRVDYTFVPMLYVYNAISCASPGIALYPDKIELKTDAFSTILPMQKTILKAADRENLFSFKLSISAFLTNKTIGFKFECNNKKSEDDNAHGSPVNFGCLPIDLNPTEYEISINTIENEYVVDFAVKLLFIDDAGLGLRLEWGEREDDKGLQHLAPKTVIITADYDIKSNLGGVPVTYGDFKIGLENIDPNKNILHWTLVGGFDLSTSKLSSYIKGIEKWLDDPALLLVDDVKASLSLAECYVGVEAELKLLEAITLGKSKIEFGKIPFSCVLLDMEEVDSYGARAELTAGIIWETDNVDIDVSGTGALNLHTQLFGIEAIGTCDITISWWVLEARTFNEGRFVLGLTKQNNKNAFVVKSRSTSSDGTKELFVIFCDGETDYGTKKL